MVSIIKNQLLKHLSRFTKNLSADKINLSTFKGEGELSNLELNEIVLTDLLELPCWLRLKQAWCNKISFRVPWTKLKSVPIFLNLDEVNITLETCEELRISPASSGFPYGGAPSKYSFIHKVIDGITISINTVNITFNSPAFTASVQITRILVESKTPKFTRSDLRMTRLKNQEKGQLLIFKEIEWQTVRIEAKSTVDRDLTPLRLLTNQARCRIVMKKRISDCFIVGSRLAIILDDLLWVLTDSQLKAALHFLNSLGDLIQKATQITRRAKAARKLEELPEYHAQIAQEFHGNEVNSKSTLFDAYDVIETSYHFLSNQIVLHLCDDPGSGRSSYPSLKDGGALQISIKKLQVDYYPYHLAKGNRKHWPRYNASLVPHSMWQEQALNIFKSKLFDLVDENKMQHSPLKRSPKEPGETSTNLKQPQSSQQKDKQMKIKSQLSKLMTSCAILRMEDFTIYKVTTSNNKRGLKEFVFGDRSRISLPKDANIVHAEFIYYYYPSDFPFPLPPPKFYVQLNPISIVHDIDSCLWLNSFGLNLFRSLADNKKEVDISNYTYVDVKIEAILPKISFERSPDPPDQKIRPSFLSMHVTRAIITNVRGSEKSSVADLAKCLDSLHMGSLFFGSDFPSKPEDFYAVTQKFLDHISADDNIRKLSLQDVGPSSEMQFRREMLWTEARDVWCINLDPFWADFHDPSSTNANKSLSFIDALPVTIWLHTHMDPNSTVKPLNPEEPKCSYADIHALLHISNLVSVQINHYQYLFLLRLAEDIALLTTFMARDAEKITQDENNSSIVMGALIPQLEISLVMPSPHPGKESSVDAESFMPDSSSMAGDVSIGSNSPVWRNSYSSVAPMEIFQKVIVNGSATCLETQTDFTKEISQQMSDIKQPIYEHRLVHQQSGNLNLQTNLNMGLTSMKKGFTSLMSSIDSALKTSPDDMSDTISIRSDLSSDSEPFVNISYEADIPSMDVMFIVSDFFYEQDRVEEASEVLEEESSVPTPSDSVTNDRRKDLIMLSTFKVNKVEFLHQSVGYSSSVKIQIGGLSCDDSSAVPWNEFQEKFHSRSRAWVSEPPNIPTMSKVQLRLDRAPACSISTTMDRDLTDRNQFSTLFKDTLTVRARDLAIDLNMSTLTGLADLIEDEFLPILFPVKVSLENIKVHVPDDRPLLNAMTGRVPLDVNITQLYIFRNEDGVFNISPILPTQMTSSTVFTEEEFEQGSSKLRKQLSLDNEELKRRLLAFERVSEENRSLRKSKDESDMLRSCLKKAQDEIALLKAEKKELLHEIKQFQEHSSTEGNWTWNSSKR